MWAAAARFASTAPRGWPVKYRLHNSQRPPTAAQLRRTGGILSKQDQRRLEVLVQAEQDFYREKWQKE
jgi:hypothetical protein